MAKKNWYETITSDVTPTRLGTITDPFWHAMKRSFENSFAGNMEAKPIESLMADLDGVGFQDMKDHYEMVTELGGNGDIKEDAVKIELLHGDMLSIKETPRVKVTYEHSVSTEHSHYSHSQTTYVTLPEDADEETVSAHFDEKNRVVVTVDKKSKPKRNTSRVIPIVGV